MTSQNPKDPSKILQNAVDAGNLSMTGRSIIASIPNLNNVFAAAMGTPAEEIPVSDTTLVAILDDDSSSIKHAGNTQHVIDGSNMVIDSVLGAKQGDNTLLLTWLLNETVPLNNFVLMDHAIRLDSDNYQPWGGTPLYDRSIAFLGATMAKVQEFEDIAVPARAISLIVSDGNDEHSTQYSAKDVAVLVNDLQSQSETHIVAAMGIDDGHTDFHKVFTEMGIDPKWILTPGNTPSEIRAAFEMFSRTSAAAAGGQASFSKTAMGGFTS